jgi:hypothetical protein
VEHIESIIEKIRDFQQQTPEPNDEEKNEFFATNIKYHDGTTSCESATGWAFVPAHSLGLFPPPRFYLIQ